MVEFGWRSTRYFTELNALLKTAAPVDLAEEELKMMIQVCEYRLEQGG